MADITCQRGAVKRHHVALANGNRVFHRRDIGGGQGRQGRDIGLGDAKRRQAVWDIALLAQIHQPIDHRLCLTRCYTTGVSDYACYSLSKRA